MSWSTCAPEVRFFPRGSLPALIRWRGRRQCAAASWLPCPHDGAPVHRAQLHARHRGGADDRRRRDARPRQLDRDAARGGPRDDGRRQARAHGVGARDRDDAGGATRARRASSCASCGAITAADRARARPDDRLGGHASVRDVGGPADRRAPALPRPGRRAALRRAPGADLRRPRARRHRRPRQGDPRRQRDARAHAAAARAVGQLAVLARRRDRPAVHPHADLPRVPARRHPADLQGLGGLREAGRAS